MTELSRLALTDFRNHADLALATGPGFVVLTGDFAQAKRMLERHLPAALNSVMLDERFNFLLAARLWTDRLLARGMPAIKLHLPDELPAADAQGRRDVAELGTWFTDQARSIAARFDGRNGTTAFQDRFDELPELLALAAG